MNHNHSHCDIISSRSFVYHQVCNLGERGKGGEGGAMRRGRRGVYSLEWDYFSDANAKNAALVSWGRMEEWNDIYPSEGGRKTDRQSRRSDEIVDTTSHVVYL